MTLWCCGSLQWLKCPQRMIKSWLLISRGQDLILTVNLIGRSRIRAITFRKCIKAALVEKGGTHFEERGVGGEGSHIPRDLWAWRKEDSWQGRHIFQERKWARISRHLQMILNRTVRQLKKSVLYGFARLYSRIMHWNRGSDFKAKCWFRICIFLYCWYRKLCTLLKKVNAEVQVEQFSIEQKFDAVS